MSVTPAVRPVMYGSSKQPNNTTQHKETRQCLTASKSSRTSTSMRGTSSSNKRTGQDYQETGAHTVARRYMTTACAVRMKMKTKQTTSLSAGLASLVGSIPTIAVCLSIMDRHFVRRATIREERT
jgi:hypothetical protein